MAALRTRAAAKLSKVETGKRVSHIVSHPQKKEEGTSAKLRTAAPKVGGSGPRNILSKGGSRASFSKDSKASLSKRTTVSRPKASFAKKKTMANRFGLPTATASKEPVVSATRLALPAPSEPIVEPTRTALPSPSVSRPAPTPDYGGDDIIGPEPTPQPGGKKIPWLAIGIGVVGLIVVWKFLK